MINSAIEADVVIVGAGLLGSSCAMHLSEISKRKVLVVDLDLEGQFSSSELNAGGVRATWNHPVNAAISKLSIDYYASVQEEVGFRQRGYFWMYSKENWAMASSSLRANPRLADLGVEYLTSSEITKRFAFIDKTEDLGGATFSPRDGLLNANLLKQHYRARAKKSGVEFVNRTWVQNVEFEQNGTVLLRAARWPDELPEDELKKILTDKSVDGSSSVQIKAKVLVNCSGAWARRFAKCMNTVSMSQPIRRQVSVFECKGLDLTQYGMFVDCSGVYFHPEAQYILGGYATPDEPAAYNFEYDGHSFFEQYIWPALYMRSTAFENLKHVTGWAGLYEVSPDKSGIVGPVEGFKNVFEAHSFSGRGAMQSFGAGLGLAELIAKGKYESIDLASLAGSRFHAGRAIDERMLI